MSLSTQLLGPYDDIATSEKCVVSAAIPPEVKERLFADFLTRRGCVDKVITRQLFVIDAYLCKYPHLQQLEDAEKEKLINNLLNSIVEHVDQLNDKQEKE